MSAPATAIPNRIVSMDQFRGYTVAGMFLVNFLGHFAIIHAVLKHNDTFFSYADSIMPSFIFAVGFSYRLTVLKRLPKLGAYKTYMSYFKRSLALILITLMTAGLGGAIQNWKNFDRVPENYAGPPIESKSGEASKDVESKKDEDSKKRGEGRKGRRGNRAEKSENEDTKGKWYEVKIPEHFWLKWRVFFLKVLKADLWEVLAIIGVCQLFIMPVIAASAWVRVVALLACMVGHGAMTHYFNWDFEHGLDALYRISQSGAEDKYVNGADRDLADAIDGDNLSFDEAFEKVRNLNGSLALEDGRTIETVIERNFMDRLWQIRGFRSWDGGFFGIVSWSVAMLAGTLVYDLMARATPRRAACSLFAWGTGLMIVGYGMSCLTRLYDLEPIPGVPEIAKARDEKIKDVEEERDGAIKRISAELTGEEKKAEEERIKKEAEPKIAAVKADFDAQVAQIKEENKEGVERASKINEGYIDSETKELHEGLFDRRESKLAASPVVPDRDARASAKGRNWKDLLAEPPFVGPPSTDPGDLAKGKPVRVWNYWMMGKRTVNQSFMTFAIGFAIFLYGAFVILCDMGSLRVGVFRTFGMNPLAAYIIHGVTEHTVQSVSPKDSPLWFCMLGFAIFFTITYLLVRGLEKQNIYIRM